MLLPLLSILFSSGNCSGEVDRYTQLTKCEQRDISRRISQAQASTPRPRIIFDIDSAIDHHYFVSYIHDSISRHHDSIVAVLEKRKHSVLLSYKYDVICNVCFDLKLSCGSRRPNDTLFVCINEGLLK